MYVLHSLLLTTLLGFQEVNFANSQNGENRLGKVIFANVIYTHGEITPLATYPSDPYQDTSFWPDGFGQLTNIGKEKLLELGKWLRNRYNSSLTEKYSQDIIYVRSSDVDRTIMSAGCNLAGIYPPKDAQIWNEDIHWQPIPIHTVPEKLDNMLSGEKPCPAYKTEFQGLLQTEEIQLLNQSFLQVFKTLNQYSGELVTTIEHVNRLYSTLMVEKSFSLSLPDWTKPIFPDPIAEAASYNFVLPTWTKKLARLKSGPLVKDLISNMRNKKENTSKPSRNIYIYSTPDTTLANLMNTLGVYDRIRPPYAACFMVELRVNSDGDHQVTMFFRNSTMGEPYLLTLPGCSFICPLDQFITLLEPVTVDDWDSECQTSGSSDITLIIVLAVLVILVLVLLTLGVIYWQFGKRSTH